MLIVGLGNPGDKYTLTRHNLGFQVLDTLAEKISAPAWKRQQKALLTKVPTPPVILAKPQTFMNLSGESVAELLHFYKLDPADLLIITDDLALPIGQLRLRLSGSSGGHKGLASIERSLGTTNFARLRLGIGCPERKTEITKYVLSKPSDTEADQLEQVIMFAAQSRAEWNPDNPLIATTFTIPEQQAAT